MEVTLKLNTEAVKIILTILDRVDPYSIFTHNLKDSLKQSLQDSLIVKNEIETNGPKV